MSNLIKREEAINAVVNTHPMGEVEKGSSKTVFWIRVSDVAKAIKALPSAEAVQECDGCRYNTQIPQEQCLRCERYWRDSYERKGGDTE